MAIPSYAQAMPAGSDTGPRNLAVSAPGAGAWPLLDETARRNMDAEIQAMGYAPTQTIDYSSDASPSYLPTALFGSDAIPSQAVSGKPAVPAGSTATAYGSATLTSALGPKWPFVLGGALLVIVLLMRQ